MLTINPANTSSLGRSRRSHGPSSVVPPGYTVVGQAPREATETSRSGNFSHIRIVPKSSPEPSQPDDSGDVFRRSSFSHEAEREMDMMRSSFTVPTASLANLTSGTTFAAKARAAELNAVRARKAAKAVEDENEVPPKQPATFRPLKPSMPHNRGAKAWKPLSLHEVQEDISEDESRDATRPATAQSATLSHASSKEQQIPTDKRAFNYDSACASYGYHDYDNDIPISRQDSDSFIDNHQVQAQQSSRSRASTTTYSTQLNPEIAVFTPSTSHSAILSAQHNAHRARVGHHLAYQPNLRPSTVQPQGPSAQSTNMYKSTMMPPRNDDPFTEYPQVNNQHGSVTKFVSKPSSLHSSTATITQSTAVKGTMDLGFRFPHATQPSFSPQAPYNSEQRPPGPKASAPTLRHIQNPPNTMTRDPKPYTSFSTSSKKEMLLQNLEQVVESSKAKGDLPNATRTVLYDPFAPDPPTQTNSSYSSTYGKMNDAGRESLRTSEPMEWQERIAPVFESPTAYTFNESHAPRCPPGLCDPNAQMYALVEESKPKPRSLEDLEMWWNNDTRAQGIPRAALNELADVRYARDPPGHRAISESFGSVTSPASTRTASSIAPIGSERSTKTNSELAEMMKQVCINLESYVLPSENPEEDCFGRFAAVPEWCIDKSPTGNDSFFGDWGVPPSRVGRDPRYRRTFHEGRHTVFEELDHRGARDGGLGRRYH